MMPPAWAGGDEIVLKDGRRIQGNIVARNAAQYYIDVEHEVQTIDASEIETIHFGPVAAHPAASASLETSKSPVPQAE